MANFFGEIGKQFGFDEGLLSGGFKLVALGSGSVYIEGHFGILSFSENEMVFKIKGGKLRIYGKNLVLKNFSKASAGVMGKILKVEFEEVGIKN